MSVEGRRPIPVASRLASFRYAIRNIAAEAGKLEAIGRRVTYLNIGDPIPFGFTTPRHLVEAVERAMAEGHNGYAPSAGILSAREAVAEDYVKRGLAVSPDRVVLTSGASEGIDLTLSALLEPGDEVLIPRPSYPLYSAILAKLAAKPVFYDLDPRKDWWPDLDQARSTLTPKARALVVINPNNPTGAVYPIPLLRQLVELAEAKGLVVLADEVYADLAYEGPVLPLATLNPQAAIISFGSLSKGYLAPGWRAGWLVANATPRLDPIFSGIRQLADGRLCSPTPMQHAIRAALRGEKSHQGVFRAALAERAAAAVARFQTRYISGSMPRAAFYMMPKVELPPGKTDQDFVLALLRETGILCVHGSGFDLDPKGGFFRLVFLPPTGELSSICDTIARFAEQFCRG